MVPFIPFSYAKYCFCQMNCWLPALAEFKCNLMYDTKLFFQIGKVQLVWWENMSTDGKQKLDLICA